MMACPESPRSSLDKLACRAADLYRTNRRVNRLEKEIFPLLETNGLRAEFIRGERHWLRYRRESCLTQASPHIGDPVLVQAFGTTAFGFETMDCEIARNKAHASDLRVIALRTGVRHRSEKELRVKAKP